MKVEKQYKESPSRTIQSRQKGNASSFIDNRPENIAQASIISKIQQKKNISNFNNGVVQVFFCKINNIVNQQLLARQIADIVPNSTLANGTQVVNDIVASNGNHTVINGVNLLHASAGNLQHTATAFYRYVNEKTVIILALGHHIGNVTYRLDYCHAGFTGNAGNNFINLNNG